MGESPGELGWQARSLLHRYCKAIDDHDTEALQEVFSDDVVLVVGDETVEDGKSARQSFTGRQTVVQILSSLFGQRNWARHLVSNELVEDRGDGDVEIRSYFQFLLAKPQSRVIGVGDYRAIMRPVGGRLRIREFAASVLDEVEIAREQATE
jgi:3-phenylpropionate/cinnamic acid dioxygenase small subunit